MKKETPDFSIVTPEWILLRLKEKGMSQVDLAGLANVKDTLISQWISGYRNPSGAAKAALYYILK